MKARVVLVGPENPLNVGLVARAMKCFGASDLVLVTSWKEVPDEARRTGTAAEEVLDSARLVRSLEDALEGCDEAVAFTRRASTLKHASFDLPDVPPGLRRAKTALVFGRESSGLTAAELAQCPRRARIPCAGTMSLNLGQAAAVALHAFSSPEKAAPESRNAPLERRRSLWGRVEGRLKAAPRWDAKRLERARRLLERVPLDDDEFDLLYAAVRALESGFAAPPNAR